MRKVVATTPVVCGLGLVTVPFALSLFARAPTGERVTNRFRERYMMGPGIALLLTGTVALAIRTRPEPAWNAVPGLPARARPS
jgi:hypothetical protein